MVTITIHRGELLQIKKIITKGKKRSGILYGLYTESCQPVVLIVRGGEKKTKIDNYLWEKHKLLPLGEWIVRIVSNSKKDQRGSNISKETVTMTFDNKGEIVSADFEGNKANLDVLEGQSAFREYQSLTKYLQDETRLDSSPIKIEEKQKEIMPSIANHHLPGAQSRSIRDHIVDVEGHNNDVSSSTRTSQWYNTDRDTFQNTFNFVRSTFTDDGTVEISRNASTEDMSFKFIHSKLYWVIEFPAEFPRGDVNILRKMRGSEEKVSLKQSEPTANLANMKNMLSEIFFNMCKCDKCCRQEPKSWV